MFEGICDVMHRELSQMEEKYKGGSQINGTDLEHIDKMAHALKCLATYDAMKSAEGEADYARGRWANRPARDWYGQPQDGYRRY